MGHLVKLALEDYNWLDLESFEGSSMHILESRWTKLKFTHFCMNGGDDVVKYGKYAWAGKNSRFITMGRPGFTQNVMDGMARFGVDPDDGFFILGPELPDISSTEARRALAQRPVELLLLWILRHCLNSCTL